MDSNLTAQEAISMWFHYEEIAMHFNDLILQYRLQVMAGAGALGAISSFFVQSKENKHTQYQLRYTISAVLFVIIFAAALLDIYYYNQLLKGAVTALLELEAAYPFIKMSTTIEAEFTGIERYIVYVWYGVILLPLGCFSVRSWRKYQATNGN